VHALGATPRGFKAELVAQTHSLLAAEEQERRRRVALASTKPTCSSEINSKPSHS
jgi:hypothetical protein